MYKRTIGEIYKYKIYNFLDEKDFIYILRVIWLSIFAFFISYLWVYPEKGFKLLEMIFLYQNFIIPKFIVTYYIVFNYKHMYEVFKDIYIMIIDFFEKNNFTQEDTIKIFGENIEKIIAHLVNNRSFKIKEILNNFIFTQSQFGKIAKQLEKEGILIRGDKNALVLSKEYSQEQILKAFINSNGKVEDIKIEFEQIAENNTFTQHILGKV